MCIFTILVISVSVAQILVSVYSNQKLDYVITSVIDKTFNDNETLTFVYDNVTNLELPNVIKNAHMVACYNSSKRLVLKHPYSYVLYLKNGEISTFKDFFNSDVYNYVNLINGILIIINDKNLTTLSEIFTVLWEALIQKIVILTYYIENEVFVKIHTSDPFHEKNECGTKANFIQSQDYNENVSIYYKTIYRNLHGCRLYFLMTRTDDLHPLVQYFTKLIGETTERFNCVYVDAVDQSLENIEGVFIGMIYNDYFYSLWNLEKIHLGIRDSLYFVVRSGEHISPVDILFVIFTTEVWIYIVVTYVVTSIMVWFITSLKQRIIKISQLSKDLLDFFSATLWGCVSTVPKRTELRCIFMCYLIYHIHVQTGFTSNLVTVLTTQKFKPGITNLEELAAANIVIHVDFFVSTAFVNPEEMINLTNILNKTVILEDNASIFDKIRNKTFDNGVLVSEVELKYLRLLVDNETRINVIDTAIYLTKSFKPFLQQMIESGISQKYYNDVMNSINTVPKPKELVPLI
ncbi:hypothetical protein FQR65_LT06782 [Abscondita terminalis]|nr:hypothetical protein FQR65_LT06782 [Abscondita terminalis]